MASNAHRRLLRAMNQAKAAGYDYIEARGKRPRVVATISMCVPKDAPGHVWFGVADRLDEWMQDRNA